MTVKELKDLLHDVPGSVEVVIQDAEYVHRIRASVAETQKGTQFVFIDAHELLGTVDKV